MFDFGGDELIVDRLNRFRCKNNATKNNVASTHCSDAKHNHLLYVIINWYWRFPSSFGLYRTSNKKIKTELTKNKFIKLKIKNIWLIRR